MQINKYYLSALSAFTIWGFFSLALKPLHDYPSLDILFYRVFLATALLLLINVLVRYDIVKENVKVFKSLSKKEKRKFLALTILGGFLLVLNWYLFMFALNHVSLNSASFAYLICPIITTILAFFIFKRKVEFLAMVFGGFVFNQLRYFVLWRFNGIDLQLDYCRYVCFVFNQSTKE